MAAFAPIVIKDGASTPTDHTFGVTSRNANLVQWDDRSAGVVAGFKPITLSYRPSTSRNGNARILIKIQDPRLAVTAPSGGSGIQPNPIEAYHTLAKVEFIIPPAADEAARKDILAYVKNLLGNQQVVDTVTALNPPV